MIRITITCSEKDKESILRCFECSCPFNPSTEKCGDDTSCNECIQKNVGFEITK